MPIRSRAQKVEVSERGALFEFKSSRNPDPSQFRSARSAVYLRTVSGGRTLPFQSARARRPCHRLHGTLQGSDALLLSCPGRRAIVETPDCNGLVQLVSLLLPPSIKAASDLHPCDRNHLNKRGESLQDGRKTPGPVRPDVGRAKRRPRGANCADPIKRCKQRHHLGRLSRMCELKKVCRGERARLASVSCGTIGTGGRQDELETHGSSRA